eukprot:CAMPEP_0172532016 /NCGR_PEP_ID=MMETSP1067-20121228/5222_1 /TAXON_ID=265564 ORGANISM="Thalassiosira punctigera, Strain Tpunct2005C2" /NCGR_SAMPLE_ID=MMETSP1067 /ASSEMBLY_ACC=CAM_ASM_000444 /LENGTH=318 /DNA_ID=CAMNT_0013316475 /DNA_START=40 /DNA_END=996 /DNA_ORIENTATION=+
MKCNNNSWSVSLIAAASLLHNRRTVAEAFSIAPSSPIIHSVHDVPCRELDIHIQSLGESITILEATSEGQEKLVDAVLEDGDDDDDGDRKGDRGGEGIVREDPYGAVLWPAASAVSEHVTRDSLWDGDGGSTGSRRPTLLELGAGTGLVALSASASNGYSAVLATDYETVPLRLLDAAYRLNLERRRGEGGMTPIDTALFDICDLSAPLPPADLVCAADILYEPKTGVALALRVVEALERGSRVVVGCSPGRPGRPAFLEELKRLNPNIKGADFVDVEGTTCTGKRHSLICGEGSTSISDEPKMLLVALMDLAPECLN